MDSLRRTMMINSAVKHIIWFRVEIITCLMWGSTLNPTSLFETPLEDAELKSVIWFRI